MRKARLFHTRKTSRKDTHKDLMTHLLLSSDPFLSSKRNIKTKKKIISADIEKYILKENADMEEVMEDDEIHFSLNRDCFWEESSGDDFL